MTVNVQFTDVRHTAICSVFANAQDPAVYPNQGTIAENDPRLLAFFNPVEPIAPITKRQLLDWLWAHKAKTAADVDAAIAAIADTNTRQFVSNAWNYPDGGLIHRTNPFVDQLGAAFGMSAVDIDAAFLQAGAL